MPCYSFYFEGTLTFPNISGLRSLEVFQLFPNVLKSYKFVLLVVKENCEEKYFFIISSLPYFKLIKPFVWRSGLIMLQGYV